MNEEMITAYLDVRLEVWPEIVAYWKRNRTLEVQSLLEEVVSLRGKVDFYESRIKQMASRLPK